MNFLLSVSVVNNLDVLRPFQADREGGKVARGKFDGKKRKRSFSVHCGHEGSPSIFDRNGSEITRE
jgi:hypothetical protein